MIASAHSQGDRVAPPRPSGVLGASAALALVVGLSTILTSWLYVEAYAPGMTRGRKRLLAEAALPAGILALTLAAFVALVLAAKRAQGLGPVLRRTQTPGQIRTARTVLLAVVLGLSTPVLQKSLGIEVGAEWSRLAETPTRVLLTLVALLAAALQEELVLRVFLIEGVRWILAPFAGGKRTSRAAIGLAVAVSVSAGFLVHGAASGGGSWSLALGLSKVPGMALLAAVYLRNGLGEATLVHAGANAVVLFLVPAIAAT